MEKKLITLVNTLKPVAHVYNFRDEKPPRIDKFLDVSALLRTEGEYDFLTFWFRWDHDWEGDGIEDWEPVTYVLNGSEVVDIQTRPHWNFVKWLTDDPVLADNKKAIVYFSKNGHAPYLPVKSRTEIGWLRNAMNRVKIGVAIPDFLEVMSERNHYELIPEYVVVENRVPPSTSRAMTGVEILGKKFFDKWYEKP